MQGNASMRYKQFHQFRSWLPKPPETSSDSKPAVKSIIIEELDFVGGKENMLKLGDKKIAEATKEDRQKIDVVDSLKEVFMDLTVQTALDVEEMIDGKSSKQTLPVSKPSSFLTIIIVISIIAVFFITNMTLFFFLVTRIRIKIILSLLL